MAERRRVEVSSAGQWWLDALSEDDWGIATKLLREVQEGARVPRPSDEHGVWGVEDRNVAVHFDELEDGTLVVTWAGNVLE